MIRRDWWLGIALVATAIVFHALFPRYERRDLKGAPIVRVDRWTGHAQVVGFDPAPLPPIGAELSTP